MIYYDFFGEIEFPAPDLPAPRFGTDSSGRKLANERMEDFAFFDKFCLRQPTTLPKSVFDQFAVLNCESVFKHQ